MSDWVEGQVCDCGCNVMIKKCPSCNKLWTIPDRHEVCCDCWLDGKGK